MALEKLLEIERLSVFGGILLKGKERIKEQPKKKALLGCEVLYVMAIRNGYTLSNSFCCFVSGQAYHPIPEVRNQKMAVKRAGGC